MSFSNSVGSLSSSVPAFPSLVWVVTSPSALSYRQCLLGEGATRKEAIADAYGPGARLPSHADCYQVTEDERDALRNAD
jgi:hypothetical protein